MKTKLIEIQVHGFTGDGKSDVCKVVKDALIAAYGTHTQVASYDMTVEENGGYSDNKPSKDTVFVIHEINHGSMCTRK